jgi:hypothetical protein
MKETERRLNTSDGRERCHAIDYLSVTTVFPLKGTPVTKHNEASARHLAPQVGFHRFKSEARRGTGFAQSVLCTSAVG